MYKCATPLNFLTVVILTCSIYSLITLRFFPLNVLMKEFVPCNIFCNNLMFIQYTPQISHSDILVLKGFVFLLEF